MSGKILAALLLVFGGGVTIYILFKMALAVIQPIAKKKIEQKMLQDKADQLQNSLKLHEQVDQTKVKQTQQNMKK
ncbi:MAG: hypothetical protein RO469_00570 [Thermincola sp.]|jgi:predicted PurR-regulated permease PerM|nr:hypothetical protein [Thermincola sp.]MDT3701474.1 hypothetical protein [Thermincola sp.]